MSTSENRSPLSTVFAGRTFAYRSNDCRSATFIERNPFPSAVSSGPFSASLVFRMLASVASGIGSLTAATAAAPASWRSHEISAPAASSSRTVASVIDGPMPSPGISVTERVMLNDGLCLWSMVCKQRSLWRHDQIGDARRQGVEHRGRVGGYGVGPHFAHPYKVSASPSGHRQLEHCDLLRAAPREPDLNRHEHIPRIGNADQQPKVVVE